MGVNCYSRNISALLSRQLPSTINSVSAVQRKRIWFLGVWGSCRFVLCAQAGI